MGIMDMLRAKASAEEFTGKLGTREALERIIGMRKEISDATGIDCRTFEDLKAFQGEELINNKEKASQIMNKTASYVNEILHVEEHPPKNGSEVKLPKLFILSGHIEDPTENTSFGERVVTRGKRLAYGTVDTLRKDKRHVLTQMGLYSGYALWQFKRVPWQVPVLGGAIAYAQLSMQNAARRGEIRKHDLYTLLFKRDELILPQLPKEKFQNFGAQMYTGCVNMDYQSNPGLLERVWANATNVPALVPLGLVSATAIQAGPSFGPAGDDYGQAYKSLRLYRLERQLRLHHKVDNEETAQLREQMEKSKLKDTVKRFFWDPKKIQADASDWGTALMYLAMERHGKEVLPKVLRQDYQLLKTI